MPVVTRRELLEAGVHFGHQTRRWNPKMHRYLFGERSGIYIIDLEKSLAGLEETYEFVQQLGRRRGIVLFIGTKKQAQEVVAEHADARRHAVRQQPLARRHAHQLRHDRHAPAPAARAARDGGHRRASTTSQEGGDPPASRAREAPAQPRRHPGPRAAARRGVRHRHEEGAHRGHRGAQARHPGDRDRRHELRPGRGRLRRSPATTTPSGP